MTAGRAPRRPRVLFLTESFRPVLGGGETHIRELSRRLVGGRASAPTVVTRRTDAAWPAEEDLDGVARAARRPVGRRPRRQVRDGARAPCGALRHGGAALRRAGGARARACSACPACVAGAWANRPVVLQPEVNGEMSGEVYTWGTALDRPLPRALVSGAVRAAQPAAARRGGRRRHVAR